MVDFVAGQVLRGSQLQGAFNPPRCKVSRSSAQPIASETETALTFPDEVYDPAEMHAGASSGILIRESGLYVFWAWATFAANTTGARELFIRVNDIESLVVGQTEGLGSHDAHVNVYGEEELAADDVLQAWVWQDSGGSLDVTKARFGARKVAE